MKDSLYRPSLIETCYVNSMSSNLIFRIYLSSLFLVTDILFMMKKFIETTRIKITKKEEIKNQSSRKNVIVLHKHSTRTEK